MSKAKQVFEPRITSITDSASPRPLVCRAAETAAVPLVEFRVRVGPVRHVMPYAPAQGRSVSPDRTAAPNNRARSSDAHGGASTTARDTAPRSIDGR